MSAEKKAKFLGPRLSPASWQELVAEVCDEVLALPEDLTGQKKNLGVVTRLAQIGQALLDLNKDDDGRKFPSPLREPIKRMLGSVSWDAASPRSSLEGLASDEVLRDVEKGKALEERAVAMNGRLKAGIAWLKVVGFLASGIAVVEDAVKLAKGKGDGWRFGKDLLSLAGSLVRDMVGTLLDLHENAGAFLSESTKEWLEPWKESARLRYVGASLGVIVAGLVAWDGWQKRDPLLGGAGLFSGAGYLLRFLGKEALRRPISFGIDVSLPLLAVGAGLEVLDAAQPKQANETMRMGVMSIARGLAQACQDWYAKRYAARPWRKLDNGTCAAALRALAQAGEACERGVPWDAFLPCDEMDWARERVRLREIGFSDADAGRLLLHESLVRYVLRPLTKEWLEPPDWPPPWPDFDEQVRQ